MELKEGRIKHMIKRLMAKHRRFSTMIAFLYRYLEAVKWFTYLIIGKVPMHWIRHTLYRFMGIKLGKYSVVYGNAEIRSPHKIVIGNHTFMGNQAMLDGRGGLAIGDNVNISTGVRIWTAQHDKNDPYFKVVYGNVVIEDYVWISCRAVILPNTRNGKGAVISAGAGVKGDIPPFSIIAGVPGKTIGERSHDLRYNLEGPIPFI